MIPLCRSITWLLDVNLSGHSEVDAEPIVAGKLEKHSLSASMRAKKSFANQVVAQRAHVGLTKDAVLFVQDKIDDLRADSGVPLFAKPFDLGQLGHRTIYKEERLGQPSVGISDAWEAVVP